MQVLIIGGEKQGQNIADRLMTKDEYHMMFRSAEHQVTFIEEDETVCKELEQRFNVPIYRGDGTKKETEEFISEFLFRVDEAAIHRYFPPEVFPEPAKVGGNHGVVLEVYDYLEARIEAGDDRAALLFLFSAVHLGLYLVTSPLADTSHATIHWPAPGYLPLIVFLPDLLRGFVQRRPTRGRRTLAYVVPGQIEHELVAPLVPGALRIVQHPLGMGTIEVAIRVDHLRLDPNAEFEAQHDLTGMAAFGLLGIT